MTSVSSSTADRLCSQAAAAAAPAAAAARSRRWSRESSRSPRGRPERWWNAAPGCVAGSPPLEMCGMPRRLRAARAAGTASRASKQDLFRLGRKINQRHELTLPKLFRLGSISRGRDLPCRPSYPRCEWREDLPCSKPKFRTVKPLKPCSKEPAPHTFHVGVWSVSPVVHLSAVSLCDFRSFISDQTNSFP